MKKKQIKHFSSLLALLCVFALLAGCWERIPDPTTPLNVRPEYKGFIRVSNGSLVDENGLEYIIYGINTTDNWTTTFSAVAHTQEGYDDIATYNMNTIRMCLNAAKFEKINADGTVTYKEDSLRLLRESIDRAAKAGLKVIIDMHNPPGGFQAYREEGPLLVDTALQTRFLNLWRYIAEAFKDNTNVLGYGLVNEPVGPYLGSRQNAVKNLETLLQKATDTIREVDKNHIIVIQTLMGTYDEKNPAKITADRITWGGFLDTDYPVVNDPQKNIMIEYHFYKSEISGYGSPIVASKINNQNVESSRTVWYDDWARRGLRTPNVTAFGELSEVLMSAEEATIQADWKNISATFSYATGEDVGVYNPKLDVLFGSQDIVVYVDNLRLVKHYPDGSQEELFFTDFNDVSEYEAMGAKAMLNYVADNPFEQGDRLLKLEALGKAETNYAIFNNLIINNGEKVVISADTLAVSSVPVDVTTVARFKSEINFYTAMTPPTPIVETLAPEVAAVPDDDVVSEDVYALEGGEAEVEAEESVTSEISMTEAPTVFLQSLEEAPDLVVERADFPFVMASVNRDNVGSTRYVWHDNWARDGLRADDVIVPEEAEPLSSQVAQFWFPVSAEIKIKTPTEDVGIINPKLNLVFANSEDIVYVDNLRLVRNSPGAEPEELFFTDFNDTGEYAALGVRDILNYIEDNPFESGDKLMKFTNPTGKAESNYSIFNKLVINQGETLTITADVMVVAETVPTDRSYARIKTETILYVAANTTEGVIIKEDRESIERVFLKYLEHSAKYDSPPYIGELGSAYVSLEHDPQSEEWFRDVSELIGEHKLGFSWHSLVGGGFGLYIERPNKHPFLEEMFRKYFVNIKY